MFTFLILSFIAFWVAILPVYLWGFGVSYLLDTPWNRRRFLLGMFIGGISVGIVWLFSYIKMGYGSYIFLSSIFYIVFI
mgnify:CR=1 FL=1